MTHSTALKLGTLNLRPLLFASVGFALSCVVRADFKADIGWTKLQAELGGALPTGAGVAVSQVEAPENPGVYGPEPASAEFAGKTFAFKSGASGVSGHATSVAGYYYGLTGSIAPGITTIDVYEANDWIGAGFLRFGSGFGPKAEARVIQSHSWVANAAGSGVEILRRFDAAIQQSEFLGVVGLNNASQGNLPTLLAGCYNGISVGRSDGIHSYGTNTADGAGRTKPEVVAPFDATSWATPTVSSAAALLRQTAPTNGRKVVALKSMLLAGATKTPFPGWSRTTTRPIDTIYGAGQLNVYRSYHILNAGQQAASTTVSVGTRGWDFNTTTAGGRRYFFDIAASNTAPGLSALVTWNRSIGGVWPSLTTSTLANVTLKLYAATGFTTGALLDSSESAVDNVEHIYQPALSPGRYALEVTSDLAGVAYGLSWYSQPTVTVAATAPAAAELGLAAGTFTITRAGDLAAPLLVAYAMSGSATAGTDYAALAGSVTIPALAASATVAITPLADSIAEGTETATLTLTADMAYSVGGSSATVTLADLPMDAWRFANFTAPELADPLLSGDAADFDHDGTSNLLEYALHLDPKTPLVAGLPVASIRPSGALALTYTRVKSATDLTYTIEVGNEVGAWSSGAAFTAVAATMDNGATESITVESLLAPGAGQKQFMRLRVTR